MESTNLTTKNYFRIIQIVFAALLLGQVIFGVIAFYLCKSNAMTGIDTDYRIFYYFFGPIIAILGLISSNSIFKIKLKRIKKINELDIRMNEYRSAIIIRFGVLEAATLINIIAYLLTCEWIFIAIAALLIIVFIILMPSPQRAIINLELSGNEADVLQDPEGKFN